jgi:hypothetical protein
VATQLTPQGKFRLAVSLVATPALTYAGYHMFPKHRVLGAMGGFFVATPILNGLVSLFVGGPLTV